MVTNEQPPAGPDSHEEEVKIKMGVAIDPKIHREIKAIVELKKSKNLKSTFNGMVNVLLEYGLIFRKGKFAEPKKKKLIIKPKREGE